MHHQIKTALRHIRKNFLYSVLNVFGLAIGLTTAILALVYWHYEHSFDKFHRNHENIFRITTTLRESKESDRHTVGATSQVQGPAFQSAIPEIASFTRVMGGDILTDITVNNNTLRLRPLYVDANFLQTFSFLLIHGSATYALARPNHVVLTRTTAIRLFGTVNVVGRTLDSPADPSKDNLNDPLMVAAVVEDPPHQSSLQFDLLFPFSYMELVFQDNNWLNAYLGTFITTREGTAIPPLINKLNRVYELQGKEQLNLSIKEYQFDPEIFYSLQPLTEIHLDPLMVKRGSAEAGIINGSKQIYSSVFGIVAAFILLMATINFINIAIANAVRRSKEVAIRKIAGSSRRQIISLFITESGILITFSFVSACLLAIVAIPYLNDATSQNISLVNLITARFIFYLAGLLLLVAVTNTLYPALLLSRFNPAEMLFQRNPLIRTGFAGKMMIIAQFIPAVILIFATLIYNKQIDLTRTKDPGYAVDAIVRTSVYGDRDYEIAVSRLKNAIAKEPTIKSVSFGNAGFDYHVKTNAKSFEAIHKTIDENYIGLLQIPLLAGSNLISSKGGDQQALVNEQFVKEAGLQNPLGATVELGEYYGYCKLQITGVVKDHHFRSMKYAITPMIFFERSAADAEMWVKLDKRNLQQGLSALEKIYKSAIPDAVFQYDFLDEITARDFADEIRWYKIIGMATFIGLIICALGLFAISHQVSYQRVKEIGVRKVLGATVSQVTWLICSQFLKLVGIALIIAIPAAWLLMNGWLQNYPYRISISADNFLITAALALSTGLVAVIFHALRAATVNTVESLKN